MSKKSFVVKLESYIGRIDEMIEHLNDMNGKKDILQKMMSELKDDFREDKKVWSSSREMDKATDIEFTYYNAVAAAESEIYVKSNSIPSSNWIDELLSARDKLEVEWS